jgi:hypothetical protein
MGLLGADFRSDFANGARRFAFTRARVLSDSSALGWLIIPKNDESDFAEVCLPDSLEYFPIAPGDRWLLDGSIELGTESKLERLWLVDTGSVAFYAITHEFRESILRQIKKSGGIVEDNIVNNCQRVLDSNISPLIYVIGSGDKKIEFVIPHKQMEGEKTDTNRAFESPYLVYHKYSDSCTIILGEDGELNAGSFQLLPAQIFQFFTTVFNKRNNRIGFCKPVDS